MASLFWSSIKIMLSWGVGKISVIILKSHYPMSRECWQRSKICGRFATPMEHPNWQEDSSFLNIVEIFSSLENNLWTDLKAKGASSQFKLSKWIFTHTWFQLISGKLLSILKDEWSAWLALSSRRNWYQCFIHIFSTECPNSIAFLIVLKKWLL